MVGINVYGRSNVHHEMQPLPIHDSGLFHTRKREVHIMADREIGKQIDTQQTTNRSCYVLFHNLIIRNFGCPSLGGPKCGVQLCIKLKLNYPVCGLGD